MRKLESLDEITRKTLTGKEASSLGRLEKCEISHLIEAICRIATSGSAAHDRRRNEVARIVKTVDQLTEAMNQEGLMLKNAHQCTFICCLGTRGQLRKKGMWTLPLSSFTKLKMLATSHIHQLSLPGHQFGGWKSWQKCLVQQGDISFLK